MKNCPRHHSTSILSKWDSQCAEMVAPTYFISLRDGAISNMREPCRG